MRLVIEYLSDSRIGCSVNDIQRKYRDTRGGFDLIGGGMSDKHSQLPDCALLRTERATFTALRS
ncbi:hypothetical protein, partial [Yersinia aldovae]|uniref:hypothetical protein n=1 Tax=Yersinia aldovae TaxID=29483 RepID=UPI001C962740